MLIEQFVVGLVGAPFGLKGLVKVRSLSGEGEHIAALSSVILRRDGADRVYEIEEVSQTGPSLMVKFRGIDTPEAAKALVGAELVTSRNHGAALGPDEFYVEDLKGLSLVLPDGEVLGEIRDVVEGGGGQLIEARLNTGESRLIPFRKEFFGDIKPEEQRAVLLERWILE